MGPATPTWSAPPPPAITRPRHALRTRSYNGGITDAFASKLSADGSKHPLTSTYLGGTNIDQGHGIALDAAGNAYLNGWTAGSFPTTRKASSAPANRTRSSANSTPPPTSCATHLPRRQPGRGGRRHRRRPSRRRLRHRGTLSTDFPTIQAASIRPAWPILSSRSSTRPGASSSTRPD